jgi:hypothetical protein
LVLHFPFNNSICALQQAVGQRRLPVVNVGDYAKVSYFGDGIHGHLEAENWQNKIYCKADMILIQT